MYNSLTGKLFVTILWEFKFLFPGLVLKLRLCGALHLLPSMYLCRGDEGQGKL
jgi:hypothetical protein